MAFALIIALHVQSTDDLIDLLSSNDPETVAYAAGLLGIQRSRAAVDPLIRLLQHENPDIKGAAHRALVRITGQTMDLSYEEWHAWWESPESELFHTITSDEEVRALREQVDRMQRDLQDEIDKSERLIWFLVFISLGLWVVFILALLYFTGHLASKLKEFKERMKEADHYLAVGREVNERTDRILEEMDRKKTEILEFFAKLKDENEGEMERFTDLLEQNTEHHIRLEVMTLRQKAEKEMEQTVAEMKATVDHEIRRMAHLHRERAEKELKTMFETFSRDAEAQTILLEANFLAANGRIEEAVKAYKRLVTVKPDYVIGWLRMGNVLRDMGKLDDSVEAYQQALTHKPDDPEVHYHLAAAYARMKKKPSMVQSLQVAFSHNGEFKDEALNDPAFKAYWDDPDFKDLAEA